jgi:hypothetical protein
MMSKLALVKNGIVENVIRADQSFDPDGIVLADDSPVSVGYTYDGSTFTAQIIVPKYQTRFTTKDFLSARMVLDTEYDLFFASTNENIMAMQKRFLGRDEMIDVSDEQYTNLIALARSLNIIATDARAEELLKGIKT